jgi:hypothetical protein
VRQFLFRVFVASWLLLLFVATSTAQSLSYTKGQNVAPAYEGWEQAADGTKYFLFGYMNRNWEEEIDVPIGPENGFNVGGADQGQPTHFLPRRNRFVFRVKVPANFGPKDELIWTLTTHGKTEKAYATLRPDYIVDDVVKASETGALGAGTSSPEVRANKPPTLSVKEIKSRTVKVSEPLTIATEVKDDGVPKPRNLARVAAAQARAAEQTTGAPPAAPPPAAAPAGAAAVAACILPETRRWYRRRASPRQEPGAPHVMVSLPWTRRRHGDVRSTAGKSVGRHPRRRQFSVGTVVERAASLARRQGRSPRHVLRARHLRPAMPRRRWRARRRRGSHHRRDPLSLLVRSL